jgi:GTP cyclohydrolase II
MNTARPISLSEVKAPLVEKVADAVMPSRFGDFSIHGFRGRVDEEILALVHGDVQGAEDVLVRLHSQCVTGDALGSLRCDCREQLECALATVAEAPCGVVLYLPQEGRGIGLLNKIRAYALQDAGLDTVEANHALGFPNDLRTYEVAAAVLAELGVQSVRLLTNNPLKIDGLIKAGSRVTGVVPLRIQENEHNAFYLDTKRRKSGHLL